MLNVPAGFKLIGIVALGYAAEAPFSEVLH